MKIPNELIGLWLAITVPVVLVGGGLAYELNQRVTPVTVVRTVVVTPKVSPTATVSATPTVVVVPTKSFKAVTPTVKGGVK